MKLGGKITDFTLESDLDDKNVRIELDDSLSPKTFKAILNNLPVEVSINKWGEELYTDRTTIAAKQEDNAKTEVNELDVAYWPEGNALCLFYGQTPKIIDSPNKDYILNQIKDGTKVIIRES